MKDYWTYDQIIGMPIKELLYQVDYFVPKLREISKRQQQERLELELRGKSNQRKPGGRA